MAAALGLVGISADICINGRSEEALQAAREKVYYAASAANVTTVAVDLSTSDGCDELVDRVPDVDILVNNLRIYEPKAVFDTPDEDWQRMFDVTVNSVLPGPTWVEMQPIRLGERAKVQGTTVEALAALTFMQRRPASLLRRYATTEEIANLICYVCSKASSATNGAVLRADGGIVTNPF